MHFTRNEWDEKAQLRGHPVLRNLTFLDSLLCRSIKETVDGTDVQNCDDVINVSRKPARTSAVMFRR